MTDAMSVCGTVGGACGGAKSMKTIGESSLRMRFQEKASRHYGLARCISATFESYLNVSSSQSTPVWSFL